VKLLGDDPSLDGLAELISDRTRGNPLFIEEVVRALTETGSLTGDRGAYRLTGKLEKLAIPPTVQAVLGARIDRLSTREKALLQSMSVIGEQVPEPILREVCELEENELGAALEALAVAELLGTEPSQGEREYSFKHPLTREVAYGSQLSEPRSQAHAAVAAAIERLYPDGLEERAALLAHHHEAAGAMREAAGWHARAAVWIANSSPTEGMERWRRLRELTAQLDSSAALRRLAVHARVAILGLGFRVGISYEEAVDVHAEGLRLLSEGTREAPDSPARAQLDASFASCLFWGGREREGFELLRAASAAAARSGDPGAAMGNASLAGSAAWVYGSFREGIEIVGRALSVAADDLKASAATLSGRRSTYGHCLWVRAACEASLGGLDQALHDFERSLEVAGEAGDPEAELFAYCFRALLRSDVLQPERGLADAERGAGLAERIGNDLAIVIAFQALAGLRSECGDFGAACAAAEQALAICRERGVGLTWEPDILHRLAAARLGLGEVKEGRAIADEAVALAERRSLKRAAVQARLTLARVLLATKDTTRFRQIAAALEGALATATEIGYLAIEPRIHLALAAFARLRAEEIRAAHEEEKAREILNAIGASPEVRPQPPPSSPRASAL
jgi:tetratricopeptide (TPR) repeat protein